MNQNEEDNKLNSTTETPEAIDTEIAESAIIEDLNETKEPVVIKKGSLLTFIAFIFSASALTVSAYLYVQIKQVQAQAQANIAVDNSWQTPLAVIEKNNNQKFSQLSTQISQLNKTNSTLQAQLNNIEDTVSKIPKSQKTQSVNNSETAAEKYDDTQIVTQINELNQKLSGNEVSIKQLQLKVSEINKFQNQTFKQLRDDLNNSKLLSSSITQPNQLFKTDHDFETTLSLLQEAHVQLNIRGNIKKAQDLLNKAEVRIKQMSGAEYIKLAKQLQNIIVQINDNKPPELFIVSNQIEALSAATKHLAFSQATQAQENQKQQDSSWYDKLIVIRKVGDSEPTKLTINEQQVIREKLKNHYEMLKISLANRDQTAWNDEISAIETLLDVHFLKSASSIKLKLSQLQTINLNPDLPNLENYLIKFKDSKNVLSDQAKSD